MVRSGKRRSVMSNIRNAFSLSQDVRRGDMVDQATAMAHIDIQAHNAGVTAREAQEMMAFERRRVMGTASICEDCGDSIPDKRRKARPFAIRCVGCQEALERYES